MAAKAAKQESKQAELAPVPQGEAFASPGESFMVPAAEMQANVGAGHEETQQSDVQIPTMVIVQKTSPQIDRNHAAYIEGAEIGDICDTLTKQLWSGDEGVDVVCAYFRMMINHVKPTARAPEFIKTYARTDEFVQQPTFRSDDGRWDMLPDGETALMEVAHHYVLPLDSLLPALIRMKKSNHHASKQINGLLLRYKPLTMPDGTKQPRPRFATVMNLRTAEQRDGADTWHTFQPTIVGDAQVPEFYAGRDLHGMLRAGATQDLPEPGEE